MAGPYIPKRNPQHKPSTRHSAQAQYRRLRPEVRADTYVRDGGRCRCCYRVLHLISDNPWMHANIHEIEGPRWKTAIDVTLRSTLTLCKECHEQVEQNKLKHTCVDDDKRCNATVRFTGTLKSGEEIDRLSEPYVPIERFRRERAAANWVAAEPSS